MNGDWDDHYPWEDEGEVRIADVISIHQRRVKYIVDNRYQMGMVDRDVAMWEEEQDAWWQDGCPMTRKGV